MTKEIKCEGRRSCKGRRKKMSEYLRRDRMNLEVMEIQIIKS